MRIDDTEINVGAMRHVVNIQRATVTQDDYGGQISTWATTISPWVEIKPLMGRELTIGRQVSANVSHAVITRYLSDITPKDRVNFNGRLFDINAVMNIDERNIKTVLLCTEAA